MTYTTTVSRDELSNIKIPDSMEGSLFEISITPMSGEEEKKAAFRRLKGIAGRELDLNMIREERLYENSN